jgi:lysophospholipase L1-like esterase
MALKPTKKFAAIAAVGAAVLAVTAAVAAPSLAASGPAPTTSGGRYLALGDSIPFGYRELNSYNAPDPTDPSTERSYATMVAKDLGLKLTNAACPGETTSSFIKRGVKDNGCSKDYQGGTQDAWRPNFPLHTTYPKGQLLFAVNYLRAHPKTKLVTLQVGANDGLVCQKQNGGTCTGDAFNAVAQQIATNLQKILTQLTGKGGYHGQIVLVNYYSVNSIDPSGTSQVHLLNQLEKGVAANFSNVRVADAFKLWADASKNTPNLGNNTCRAGLETYINPNEPPAAQNDICGIHPSKAGQALIATAVDRAVRKS